MTTTPCAPLPVHAQAAADASAFAAHQQAHAAEVCLELGHEGTHSPEQALARASQHLGRLIDALTQVQASAAWRDEARHLALHAAEAARLTQDLLQGPAIDREQGEAAYELTLEYCASVAALMHNALRDPTARAQHHAASVR